MSTMAYIPSAQYMTRVGQPRKAPSLNSMFKKPCPKTSRTHLPSQLWLRIFSKLDYISLKNCQRVCTTFRHLMQHAALDSILFRDLKAEAVCFEKGKGGDKMVRLVGLLEEEILSPWANLEIHPVHLKGIIIQQDEHGIRRFYAEGAFDKSVALSQSVLFEVVTMPPILSTIIRVNPKYEAKIKEKCFVHEFAPMTISTLLHNVCDMVIGEEGITTMRFDVCPEFTLTGQFALDFEQF